MNCCFEYRAWYSSSSYTAKPIANSLELKSQLAADLPTYVLRSKTRACTPGELVARYITTHRSKYDEPTASCGARTDHKSYLVQGNDVYDTAVSNKSRTPYVQKKYGVKMYPRTPVRLEGAPGSRIDDHSAHASSVKRRSRKPHPRPSSVVLCLRATCECAHPVLSSLLISQAGASAYNIIVVLHLIHSRTYGARSAAVNQSIMPADAAAVVASAARSWRIIFDQACSPTGEALSAALTRLEVCATTLICQPYLPLSSRRTSRNDAGDHGDGDDAGDDDDHVHRRNST